MKRNKGFSLVELLVVMAVMAVLVGLVAVNVVRYIEKAKIGTDERYVDSITTAITVAIMDPEVIRDPSSDVPMALLDSAIQGHTSVKLSDLAAPAGNRLAKEIMDSMGWSSLNNSEYIGMLKSKHTADSEILIQHKGGAITPYAVWVTHTDASGRGDLSKAPTEWTNIGDCISVQ